MHSLKASEWRLSDRRKIRPPVFTSPHTFLHLLFCTPGTVVPDIVVLLIGHPVMPKMYTLQQTEEISHCISILIEDHEHTEDDRERIHTMSLATLPFWFPVLSVSVFNFELIVTETVMKADTSVVFSYVCRVMNQLICGRRFVHNFFFQPSILISVPDYFARSLHQMLIILSTTCSVSGSLALLTRRRTPWFTYLLNGALWQNPFLFQFTSLSVSACGYSGALKMLLSPHVLHSLRLQSLRNAPFYWVLALNRTYSSHAEVQFYLLEFSNSRLIVLVAGPG